MDDVQTYDSFMDRAYFDYAWTLWPYKCYISNRWVWGKHIKGIAVWTGPGDDVVECRHYHRDEGLMLLLKNKNPRSRYV